MVMEEANVTRRSAVSTPAEELHLTIFEQGSDDRDNFPFLESYHRYGEIIQNQEGALLACNLF
jgi:hypothetical protein